MTKYIEIGIDIFRLRFNYVIVGIFFLFFFFSFHYYYELYRITRSVKEF